MPSNLVRTAIQHAGINPKDIYVTAAVKFPYPGDRQSPLAGWVDDCRTLLETELRTVQPQYVYLMGAQAVASLFPKQKLKDALTMTMSRGNTQFFFGSSLGVVQTDAGKADSFRLEATKFFKLAAGDCLSSDADIEITLIDSHEKLDKWISVIAFYCVYAGKQSAK